MSQKIPVSVVIATKDRPAFLKRTITSMAQQSVVPAEVVVVDGSLDGASQTVCEREQWPFTIIFIKASQQGAASQRMEGIRQTNFDVIWFADDDIILEPLCTERLWRAFEVHPQAGAVSAMITNQRYTKPGKLTQTMFRIMDGRARQTYAGLLIGPAWNLLPEDEPSLPEYVLCEWLNTTCTLYRKAAFPSPVFDHFFSGYSLMEDVAVSSVIGRTHLLVNARTARIFHDSQPGSHKNNVRLVSEMALVNRFYVMTRVLGRTGWDYVWKLFLLEAFGIATSLRTFRALLQLPQVVVGKIVGWIKIIRM
jgi:glycosyltransferase involved in cell wall biosynthesis